jgi:hypothetical protein
VKTCKGGSPTAKALRKTKRQTQERQNKERQTQRCGTRAKSGG